jgi:hypothetical protein
MALRLVESVLSSSSGRRRPAGHPAKKCDTCHRSFNRVPRAPMLQDAVWCRLADEKEVLCAECCFERAFELNIDLAGWPRSYFNLLTTAQKHGPGELLHIFQWYMEMLGVPDRDEIPNQQESWRHRSTSPQDHGSAL